MRRRTPPPGNTPLVAQAGRAERREGDDRLNEQMAEILRQGAAARDAREAATAGEEIRANARMTDELRSLVDRSSSTR